jgi:phosphocarrier protein
MTKHATATVTVLNDEGLHMRPVDLLVQTANRFKCEITFEKGSQKVDCRSYLAMLGLGATGGEQLTVDATGDDADEAVAEIVKLFDQKFNEASSQGA